MPVEFQAVQCFKCRTFQVQQVSKAARGGNKFGCRMCSEKQSIRKVYAVGAAKDMRAVVVRLSSLQGEHSQASACAALNTNITPFHSSLGAPGDEMQGSTEHRGSAPQVDCSFIMPGSRGPPVRGAGSINWSEFLEDSDQGPHGNDYEEALGNDEWDQGGARYVTALPESNRKRPRRERSRQAAAAAAEAGGPGGLEAAGQGPREYQGMRSRSWPKPAPAPRFPVDDTARGDIGGCSSGLSGFRGLSGAQQPQQSGRNQQHSGTASAPSRAPCNAQHQEHPGDRFSNRMGFPSASSSSLAAAAAAAAVPPVNCPSVQPRSLEPIAARNAQLQGSSNHRAASARQAAGSMMGSRWDAFVEEDEEEIGRGVGGASSASCQDGNSSSHWGPQRHPAPNASGGRWGAAAPSGGSCWGGGVTGTGIGGEFTTCLD